MTALRGAYSSLAHARLRSVAESREIQTSKQQILETAVHLIETVRLDSAFGREPRKLAWVVGRVASDPEAGPDQSEMTGFEADDDVDAASSGNLPMIVFFDVWVRGTSDQNLRPVLIAPLFSARDRGIV